MLWIFQFLHVISFLGEIVSVDYSGDLYLDLGCDKVVVRAYVGTSFVAHIFQ